MTIDFTPHEGDRRHICYSSDTNCVVQVYKDGNWRTLGNCGDHEQKPKPLIPAEEIVLAKIGTRILREFPVINMNEGLAESFCDLRDALKEARFKLWQAGLYEVK